MSGMNVDDIKQLVKLQLESIDDDLVRNALEELLIKPYSQIRTGYGMSFECWVVALHADSDTAFIYCQNGLITGLSWGLVCDSDLDIGMDSSWFDTLEDTFYDSWATEDLPIWNVIDSQATGSERIVESSLPDASASVVVMMLNRISDPKGNRFRREPRTRSWW